jgi:hypothetical protein
VLADNKRFELVELLVGRVVAGKPKGALEVVDDRVERPTPAFREANGQSLRH